MTATPHPNLPEPDEPRHEQPPEALTGVDASAGVDMERREGPRSQISNAMVALKKRFYGKGPERARSYIVDDYVFCALEGGLTRNEETLLEAGHDEEIRRHRLLFQATMAKTTTAAIEQILGREVLTYHSQIMFHPTRSFEIFVLGERVAPDSADGPADVR